MKMKSQQTGAALVELALILPFLVLLSFITTEFGRAMYQYNTLAKSVRDAARYIAVQPPGANIDKARNLVVFGNTAGSGTPLVIGLNASMVVIPPPQATGASPVINTVTVTISGYNFRPLFQNVFGLAFANANGDIPYSDISATMRAPS